MLDELFQFDLGHVHERVNFVFRSLEILDAEGVDCYVGHAGLVAYFEDLVAEAVWSACERTPPGACKLVMQPTFARASNPKLCPSTVSIRWVLAYRLFPSITKATCFGIGPCRRAPMSTDRSWLRAHSAGGEDRSHRRTWDMCLDVIVAVQ